MWVIHLIFNFYFFYVVTFLCRISEYMDLTPAEVVGHTCYHFIHVEDLENLRQSHEDCKSQQEILPTPSSHLHIIWLKGADEWRRACGDLVLSCCDRRPLLTASWTAKPITGSRLFPPFCLFCYTSSQCWGRVRWWLATTVGSRGGGATCGSSPLPLSPLTTKPPTSAMSSGSTTSWGQYDHGRTFHSDAEQVDVCRHHTVYKDPLKGKMMKFRGIIGRVSPRPTCEETNERTFQPDIKAKPHLMLTMKQWAVLLLSKNSI